MSLHLLCSQPQHHAVLAKQVPSWGNIGRPGGVEWRPVPASWSSHIPLCMGSGRPGTGLVASNGRWGGFNGGGRLPLLDGYLLREMVPPFVIALGVGTTLGLSLGALVGLVREVVASGLPLGVAMGAATLQLPFFASQMMPMACMAATLFGLGRLKADNEIVALLAAGVPMWRMLIAPACLCGAAVLLKLACNDFLVPLCSSHARKMVEVALTTHIQSLRQNEDILYPRYGTAVVTENREHEPARLSTKRVLQQIWYAQKMEGAHMSGLMLLGLSSSGQVEHVVLAEDCEWKPHEGAFELRKAAVLELSQHPSTCPMLQADSLQVPSMSLAQIRPGSGSSPADRTRKQLLHEIALLEFKGSSSKAGQNFSPSSRGSLQSGDEQRWSMTSTWMQLREKKSRSRDQGAAVALKCALLQRDAAAVSCIAYGLIGATATLSSCTSTSISSKKRSKPFAISILCAVLYMGISGVCGGAGYVGILSPAISAWLPVMFGLSLGLFILWLR